MHEEGRCAEFDETVIEKPLGTVGGGKVGLNEDCVAAFAPQRGRRFFAANRIDIAKQNARTLPRNRNRDSASDAKRRAGDDGRLLRKQLFLHETSSAVLSAALHARTASFPRYP